MTVKVAVHRVCDRCQHPFDESLVPYGNDLPKFPKRRIAAVLYDKDTGNDTVLFGYDDLCPDCERVVDGYIKRIRLDEPTEETPPKKKSGRKSSEKPPEMTGAIATETSAKEARFEPVEIPGVVPAIPLEAVLAPLVPSEASITELPGVVSSSPEKQAEPSHPF
jgi:hypothetical protein